MEKKYHIDYSFHFEPVYYNDTALVQLGRLYCAPSSVIDKHVHINWYELTIVTDGEGIITTNDIPLNVSKGDIYFSHPGDFHEIISSDKSPLKYDFFAFNTKNPNLKKEFKDIVASTAYCYEQRVFRNEKINTSVSDAIAEISSKQEHCDDILCSLFELILFYIIRNYKSENSVILRNNTNSYDELCFQIMHYIDTHIYTIKSLSVLSEKFKYNYSYLSDIFKKNTGTTIINYYNTRRLNAAHLLIIENKLNISKIAEILNYSSPYSFSKAFKQKYGVSPKKFSKASL